MNSHRPLSREDLRMCVDVVKAIARDRGVSRDPTAVARIMATVARYYRRGTHEPSALRAAAPSEIESNSLAGGALMEAGHRAEAP